MSNALSSDIKSIKIMPYKNFICALAIIALFLIGNRFMLLHFATREKSLDFEKNKVEDGKLTVKQWNRLQGEFNILRKNFFIADPLLFRKFVEEKAKNLGIAIDSSNFSRTDQGEYWEEVADLTFLTSYKNTTDFFDILEKRGVKVDSISMERRKRRILARARLVGFILKEEE